MPRRKLRGSHELYHIPRKIRAGTYVMMRYAQDDPLRKKYVAEIRYLTVDEEDDQDVKVHIRWYYHPEETRQGRKDYHGNKEILRSDHYDVQSPQCIENICYIHSLERYLRRGTNIRHNDYFCRFSYKCRRRTVHPKPSFFTTYCVCRQPNNPDRPMIKCGDCSKWFHFDCIGLNRIQQQQNRNDDFELECSHHEQYERVRRGGRRRGDGI